jgi:hypothetical protein
MNLFNFYNVLGFKRSINMLVALFGWFATTSQVRKPNALAYVRVLSCDEFDTLLFRQQG